MRPAATASARITKLGPGSPPAVRFVHCSTIARLDTGTEDGGAYSQTGWSSASPIAANTPSGGLITSSKALVRRPPHRGSAGRRVQGRGWALWSLLAVGLSLTSSRTAEGGAGSSSGFVSRCGDARTARRKAELRPVNRVNGKQRRRRGLLRSDTARSVSRHFRFEVSGILRLPRRR